MSRSPAQGFTLIELMITIAIMSVIASIAVPNLLSSRKAANESSAISTLRMIVTAQTSFKTTGTVDSDLDAEGEYGTLGEMAGLTPLNARGPGPATPLDPPLLSSTFSAIDANGRVSKSGYYLLIYLADAAVAGVPEAPGGGPQAAVDADESELFWIAYAWPMQTNLTGDRVFCINHRGEIMQSRMNVVQYGDAVTPPFAAALTGPLMSDPMAKNVPGQDGNDWTPVQ